MATLEYGLHPWPKDVMPSVYCLLAYYKKTDPELTLKEVGHAAWHLIGYAGGQIDPHPAAGPALDEGGDEAGLESIKADDGGTYGAIPWALLLQFALMLLERLVNLKDAG